MWYFANSGWDCENEIFLAALRIVWIDDGQKNKRCFTPVQAVNAGN